MYYNSKNSRRHNRYQANLDFKPLNFVPPEKTPIFISNIGLGGVFVSTPKPLPINGNAFVFETQILNEVLQITAEKRWENFSSKPGAPNGYGLEFVTINPQNKALLDTFLRQQEAAIKVLAKLNG